MKEKVFSSECDTFGIKMDELIDKEDFEQLLDLLTQLEEYSVTHDSVEFSPIFYFLGTGYSELAAHLHTIKRVPLDAESNSRKIYPLRSAAKALTIQITRLFVISL